MQMLTKIRPWFSISMILSWCCAVLAAAASTLAAINYDNDDIELGDYLQHDDTNTEHDEAARRWYSPPKVYHHHNDHQHERNHTHQHLQDHKHKVLQLI